MARRMSVDEYRALAKKPLAARRSRAAKPAMRYQQMAGLHVAAQMAPPPFDRILRVVGQGELVAMFFLPLELCLTEDARRHREGWQFKEDREKLLDVMRAQLIAQKLPAGLTLPLPTIPRPMIICVRYSSVEPDVGFDGKKMPLDVLQVGGVRKGKPYAGLGVIHNDRPSECEVHEWWEPAEVNKGFTAIEVWTGE